ncbi:MAG TPA: low-complexity protein, partial [Cyanobacteria bacterium UBA11148]|nr:low-complexity protein [Cyanobacteria bacterium UBA11148]
ANLSGANLSEADLRGANVANAEFARNPGISREMKQVLRRRGAIFEDVMSDRSGVLTSR